MKAKERPYVRTLQPGAAVLFTKAILSKQKQDYITSTWSIGFLWFPHVYNFSKSILTKNLDSDTFLPCR